MLYFGQVTYFTGTYPLYNSVLYSNDIFKNTFLTKFSKKLYSFIVKQLDSLLFLESDLNGYIEELSYATNEKDINNLNKIINYKKNKITNLFFQAQNHIMKSCFTAEFNKIKTLNEIHEFKNNLYNYKNIIGSNNNYTFYNDFYCLMMNAIESKKEYIKEHGEVTFPSEECTALMVINTKKDKLLFMKTFFRKLKELIKLEISKDAINE